MMRKSVVAALALAAIGVWALGCEDEPPRQVELEDAVAALEDEYCARMFDCECQNRRYGDEMTCDEDVTRRVEQMRMIADQAGLIYDSTCLGGFLQELGDLGCGSIGARPACDPGCRIYVGRGGPGDACTNLGQGLSDCGPGLVCTAGQCADPCARAGNGQSCADLSCAQDLYCDDNQVCTPLPAVGDACWQGNCASGSYCDQPDPMDPSIRICAAAKANDDPCMGHGECQSLHCPRGACEPLPGRDQACPAGLCAPGLSCVETVCRVEPEVCGADPPL
jgi:hypothetical protein